MAKKAKITGGSKSKAESSARRPARNITSRVSPRSQSRPGKALTKAPSSGSASSRAPSETQSVSARRASLRSRWERAATNIALTSALDALENVTAQVQEMNQALSDIRARGYRFGRNWESRATELDNTWSQLRQQALRVIQQQQRSLGQAAQSVETLLRRAEIDDGLIDVAESRVDVLEATIREAEQQVRQTYDAVEEQINDLESDIQQAQFLLDALDAASFSLLPDEHGIAACKAVWVSDPEEPEGFLFLTDARLIFEQRQEIAKKKFLFITTEKELLQSKLWESPIGAVEEIEAEDKGAFLRRKQLLTLRFSERTRETPGDVVLELKGGDNEAWRSLIRRAKTGEIEADRLGAPPPHEQLATEIAQETASPEKELPTSCPNCDAPLPPIFKGMKQVTCEYCGTVINI